MSEIQQRVDRRNLYLSPRDFNKILLVAAAVGLSGCIPKVLEGIIDSNQIPIRDMKYQDLPEVSPLEVPEFGIVPKMLDLEKVEEWNAEILSQRLEQAVAESIRDVEEKTVNLPKGEIMIDRQITVTIPEGAKIRLRGHTEGTRLKLNPSLSDIPKEWGFTAKNNLLYFKDVEGELTLNGIEFLGGSERAGQGGYIPPASPWDSVVLIVGKGEGDQYDSAMHRAGKRKGKANVAFCGFYQSESEGLMMQNLAKGQVKNIWGKNLDVLFNSSWCDDIIAYNAVGENFTSDGTYITSAQNLKLRNWNVKTARQGYDLQGVVNAVLNNCHAYDCGYGYVIGRSETDKKTWSGKIELNNCHSLDCQIIFALGWVRDFTVNNGRHDGVGNWYKKYVQKDFLHKDGIRNPEQIFEWNSPILPYQMEGFWPEKTTYDDVVIRLTAAAQPNTFKFSEVKQGITYVREAKY